MRTCLDRALTFAGATLAAVYAPGAAEGELRLVDTSGGTPSGQRPPERLPLSGDSPAVLAYRTDRPLWLPPGTPPGPLGALPLDAEGRRLGCLLVLGSSADGFNAKYAAPAAINTATPMPANNIGLVRFTAAGGGVDAG